MTAYHVDERVGRCDLSFILYLLTLWRLRFGRYGVRVATGEGIFRFLWPCIVNKVWRERKPTRCNNQMFIINLSQHVSGIIMLRQVDNKHLIVASCWFSLSSQGKEYFCSPKCPNLLWGPPKIPFSRYGSFFPSGQSAGAWSWPLQLVPRLRMSGAVPLLPLYIPSWCGRDHFYHFIEEGWDVRCLRL
jgi:hypothetical protein